MHRPLGLTFSLLSVAHGQLVGTNQPEVHPGMTWQSCTAKGSCTTNNGKVVIDANWRWLHDKNSYTNCYTGNTWDITLCPNDETCAANCALEGADYPGTYGITTSSNSLQLKLVTKGPYSTNIGARTYLMQDDNTYQIFKFTGANEFSFHFDVSNLPCGLNGALYFVSMDADGGLSKYPTNKAGAKYGTGYCDSQCPRDLKFINGEKLAMIRRQANVEGWTPSSSDPNAGVGGHGSCCAEMDIWEANSISSAVTPHACSTIGQTLCSGDACGGTYSSNRYSGWCDPDGCDFNSYRMGAKKFYGAGKTVDTTKKFTVVTQFIRTGANMEIERFYVQNGKVIANSNSAIAGVTGNSITTNYCNQQKAAFGDPNIFAQKGGMANMASALSKGMVLVMSLWGDHYADMLWLDSDYPTSKSASTPGVARGSSTSSGVPANVESQTPSASVVFSNIRFGPLNSTFS